MTVIFEGKKFAAARKKILAEKIADFSVRPKLVAFLIGDDEASKIYINLKEKAASKVGIDFIREEISENAKAEEITAKIEKYNHKKDVLGIMVQLPLPESFLGKEEEIVDAISPEKDVDCLTSENLGLLMKGKPRYLPAAVKATLDILKEAGYNGHNLAGKNICLVGGSTLVGKPLAMLLSDLGATVTLCRSKTENLANYTKQADILISATGVADLITADMVKDMAVIIDVGSPKGDVDFEEVKKKSSFITPVPGGVGPVTVSCLLENLIVSK